MELSITNTQSYYIIQTAFDSYNVGDKIDVDTYLALSDEKKDMCYSSIVTLNFNPDTILLDMTNENFAKATDIRTTNIDGHPFISGFTLRIEASSSVNIRFYKKDITQDYTYPNENNNSEIQITSI